MPARPLVTVMNIKGQPTKQSLPMPAVFSAPIRLDLVNFVHTNMAKNHRQPYAVSDMTGHQTSAESWGTGRAVARIPRVPGGGTHRAGQGAYGNMCRGGRMFAPTKIWRRWHRRINITMKRHAVCSALAASAIPALVQARGHRVAEVSEIPLVVDVEGIKNISKTKEIVSVLKNLRILADVEKAARSRKIRAGHGKMRNRRHTMRKGPLFVFKQRSPLIHALRNLPGVDIQCVTRLNLLKLAPGGHVGRFIVWTSDAFKALDEVFGTDAAPSKLKGGYHMPRPKMTNCDLTRIIRSDKVRQVLRDAKQKPVHHMKRNPLRNLLAMSLLNPFAVEHRRQEVIKSRLLQEKREARKDAIARRVAKKTKKPLAAGVSPKPAKCGVTPKKVKPTQKPVPKKELKPAEKKAAMKARNKARLQRKRVVCKRFRRDTFNNKHREQRAKFVKFLTA